MKLFTKGSRVSQANYGAGTVTSSDERYTIIEFDQHGRRVFLTDMVTLGKTDEPAPNRPSKERRKKAAPKTETAAPAPKAAPKTVAKAPTKAVTKAAPPAKSAAKPAAKSKSRPAAR